MVMECHSGEGCNPRRSIPHNPEHQQNISFTSSTPSKVLRQWSAVRIKRFQKCAGNMGRNSRDRIERQFPLASLHQESLV